MRIEYLRPEYGGDCAGSVSPAGIPAYIAAMARVTMLVASA